MLYGMIQRLSGWVPAWSQAVILFNWDDGTNSDWLGPFESGTEICETHSWKDKGSYFVSAFVKDEFNDITKAELEVKMPLAA